MLAYSVVAHTAPVFAVASAGKPHFVVLRLPVRLPAVVFAVFALRRIGAVGRAVTAYRLRVTVTPAVTATPLGVP